MTNPNTKLAPPWDIYMAKLQHLFLKDPQISITRPDSPFNIHVTCSLDTPPKKVMALKAILPETINIGGQNITITVAYEDTKLTDMTVSEAMKNAFAGNNAVVDVRTVDDGPIHSVHVVFKKEVVQYYSDNIADLHGNTSTLYEDLARDVLMPPGVFYCTALGTPYKPD